jgi:hypothetical protein
LSCACAQAAPFTPASDSEVVERLPAATDPTLRTVESLRRQLAARPGDTELRLDIARRYFDLAMAQGDPRYVGYASATLAPIADAAQSNARYWLVRGLLQQYGHDFVGALVSLAKSSELDPRAVEPMAWRAAIHMVQARYAQALQECERLTAIASPLFVQGCVAYARASNGQLEDAYESLDGALAAARRPPAELALWQHTRLAEMAVRLQRWEEAERHFRSALDLGMTDQFLLAAYADFLLQRERPDEVLGLLVGWERSDVLLLRLAQAGKAVRDGRATGWAQQLRERFRAAAQRGDGLHEQEAARFALDIDNDPGTAVELARRNYARQKEPRDAQILMRAALAAKRARAARPALDWLEESRFEDPELQALARQLEAAGARR